MPEPFRWIKITEEHPEAEGWFLVYADGAMNCRGWNSESGRFEDWCNSEFNNIAEPDITHWMRLAPPIEEERSTK